MHKTVTKLNKIRSKQLFKRTFKDVFLNYNFILFHFVIFFIPFYSTLISAMQGPNGALYVISVGLATSFITIFNQFLFLLSAALIFVCKNHRSFYSNMSVLSSIDRNSVNSIIFLASLFSIGFFILTSYFYISYSSAYQNIVGTNTYALNYTLMLCPSLIFNAFIYLNLIYLNESKRGWVTYLIVVFLLLNVILIPVFYLNIDLHDENLKTLTIGLAISICSFVMCLVIHFIFNGNRYYLHFKWKQTWDILKRTSTFMINFLLATFMKTILIVAIAISLALSNKDTPVNLMLAKIMWYNSLYFCEFFADGILYSIEYANMKNFANQQKEMFSGKAWLSISLISGLVVLITCVVFNLCVPTIANLYTSHQFNEIATPLPPNWPYKGIVNAQEVVAYMWAPDGVYNFKLFDRTTMSFVKVPAYAIMYTTIYHVMISITKVMGISKIKINEKLNLKAIISKFIIVAIVMVFISVFSIVPSDSEWFNKLWPGIDGFSFSLMLIGILLFLMTFMGVKKGIDQKENAYKLDYNFKINI